jgi:hypothetical protein
LLAEVERLRSLWSSVAVRQQMSIKGLQAEARGRAEYGARLRARVAALESERAERNVVLHDVQVENAKLRTRIAELRAVEFEEMRQALLAAGHPEVAHDWLDADPDTAFPLPGVAHPRVEEGAS